MVFVDVGANIGSHAINAARLVGRTGSVFAFEADPDTYRILAENIESNDLRNIMPTQTCVSDHVGTLSFYKHKDSAKSSIVDRGEKAFRDASIRHVGQPDSREYENRYFESGCGGSGTQRTEGGAPIF